MRIMYLVTFAVYVSLQPLYFCDSETHILHTKGRTRAGRGIDWVISGADLYLWGRASCPPRQEAGHTPLCSDAPPCLSTTTFILMSVLLTVEGLAATINLAPNPELEGFDEDMSLELMARHWQVLQRIVRLIARLTYRYFGALQCLPPKERFQTPRCVILSC